MKHILPILFLAASGFGAPPEVTEWVRVNAIALKTVEAGNGFEDLHPLKAVMGNARIVAFGEATHGTREFFQLKHRMLEFLVEEMGFTVFAIEANWPESLAVNDYVLEGRGDPAAALRGMYFWTWNTEEVLALIQWMRRYNEDPKHGRKVKFVGFDMQTAKVAAERVREYLEELDGEFVAPRVPLFAPYLTKERTPLSAEAEQLPEQLIARLDELKDQFSAQTSPRQWAEMRQCAVLLRQYAALRKGAETPYAVRDRAMAENVRWLLEQEGPGTKMMLWAHNGHVSHARGSVAGADSVGRHLREAYGDRYVAVGFSFQQGGFQAVEMQADNKPGKLRTFTVKPAVEGGLDDALASAGLSMFALDLRKVPSQGPVRKWFQEPHKAWSIGAMFTDRMAERFQYDFRILEDFDALLFVAKTSAARPNAQAVTTQKP